MKMSRRILAAVLMLCLMLPMGLSALAEGTNDTSTAAGLYQAGAFAAETGDTVYFAVNGVNDTAGLYSVPSEGGAITLLETQSAIKDIIAVGNSVYYLRYLNSAWQLVRREAETVSIVTIFGDQADVGSLGYYDGYLYVISGGFLFAFNTVTGLEQLVTDSQMSEYCILGGRIYFVSTADQRTYQRVFSSTEEIFSVTAGCLYSMALDGSDEKQTIEIGVSDLRGYGEYLYFHNYSDNYFVANSSGTEKWLDGKLYRYNIVTTASEKAYDSYDWDFYPCNYGLLLYTSQSVDLYDVSSATGIQLMAPEIYTSICANAEFGYVYEHTTQSVTKVPLNGEISILLGEGLPATVGVNTNEVAYTTDETGSVVTGGDYIFPESSERKLTVEDLKGVNPVLWAYGRNEIYARHGYKFKKAEYANYFSTKSWYKVGGFSTTKLNDYERYNMDFIKKYESKYASKIEAIKNGTEIYVAPTGKSTAETTVSEKDNTYIFPNSSTELLTEEQILNLDRSLWGYARNEIYARHGYKFKKAQYAKYFAEKAWYTPGGFSTSQLNDIEKANMDLIKSMEAKY